MPLRVLNLYAGLGGNRHLWGDIRVTAVEHNVDLRSWYAVNYPSDEVILGDAHKFLLNVQPGQYDFIWSSPPCQSHSRMSGRNQPLRYPSGNLFEEIVWLSEKLDTPFVVENVRGWYKPPYPELITDIGRHRFWSNVDLFGIQDVPSPEGFINKQNQQAKKELAAWLGIPEPPNIYLETHDPTQCLRNCVHPELGRDILGRVRP